MSSYSIKRIFPKLQPGDTVRIRSDREVDWGERGEIANRRDEPRSYNVRNSKNNVVRRNRVHLKPTKEIFKPSISHEQYDFRSLSDKMIDSEVQNEVDDSHQVVESDVLQEKYDEDKVNDHTRVTRSGRIRKLPERFNDYELTNINT